MQGFLLVGGGFGERLKLIGGDEVLHLIEHVCGDFVEA